MKCECIREHYACGGFWQINQLRLFREWNLVWLSTEVALYPAGRLIRTPGRRENQPACRVGLPKLTIKQDDILWTIESGLSAKSTVCVMRAYTLAFHIRFCVFVATFEVFKKYSCLKTSLALSVPGRRSCCRICWHCHSSQSRPRKEKDENLGKGTTKEIFKVRNFFCNVLQL